MEPLSVAALVAALAAAVLVLRGWDVRLVLLGAALLLGGLAGELPRIVRTFLATFANERFVVPICSAMGFAYVLRQTGCDRHLVALLLRPLRRRRAWLIPGVILSGFLVNMPVISQTSTAVCVGTVAIPLLRAAGYAAPTAGACLLLGASVGGELLNPGAPELLTIYAANPDRPHAAPTEQVRRTLPPVVFVQLGVSLAVMWWLSRRWERTDAGMRTALSAGTSSTTPTNAVAAEMPLARFEGDNLSDIERLAIERPNLARAAVSLVPLAILLAAGPPLQLIDIPDEWLVLPVADGGRDPAYHTRLVGAAMLVGVAVAALAVPSQARDCLRRFFEGAGYGFAQIVSLIVTAHCFGTAMESVGLAQEFGRLVRAVPELLVPLAVAVPLTFAALCGSGMASTQSLYGFFHGPAVELDHDPVEVGALVAVGSAAGRTMSPVAAVTLMCAQMTGTSPLRLAGRVAGPLVIGIAVVTVGRAAGWL